MITISKENIQAAQDLYVSRIKALKPEVEEIANRGRLLGQEYEQETMSALNELDKELDGLQEGLLVLQYLLRG